MVKYTGMSIAIMIGLCFMAASLACAATYYVRTDGGSATQCNGLADAPYPGSGTGQNCWWLMGSVRFPVVLIE